LKSLKPLKSRISKPKVLEILDFRFTQLNVVLKDSRDSRQQRLLSLREEINYKRCSRVKTYRKKEVYINASTVEVKAI